MYEGMIPTSMQTVETLDILDSMISAAFNETADVISQYGTMKMLPEYRLPYSALLFDVVKFDEPHFSKIFKTLLAWRGNDASQPDYPFLRAFMDMFLGEKASSLKIEKPAFSAEVDHIDIRVVDRGYDIIIENKICGAPFQRNQLARYLNRGSNGKKIFLVILPLSDDKDYLINIPDSVWKLPPDWHKPNSDRACAVDGDIAKCCCDESKACPHLNAECKNFLTHKKDGEIINWRSEAIIIREGLIDWVTDTLEKVPIKEEPQLYGLSLQLISYLKKHFHISENDKLNMDLKKYISDKFLEDNQDLSEQISAIDKQITNVDEILQQLKELRDELDLKRKTQQVVAVFKKIIQELGNEVPKFQITDGTILADCPFCGFKMENGLYVGIESGDYLYWAILNPDGLSDKQIRFADKVMKNTGLEAESTTVYRWRYTPSEEETIYTFCKLFNSAKTLGTFM